ncbi:uncharacterized protein THITE_2109547 [Thermothielavioides terrestris NRRL 8126]|uniref:Cytochrome P450 n=3 Tax=Thermothielavioides terrestris TaxID=2587410 RepID=G2QWF9_THETT|nr:uncharacterized protein THITE_2109547 [Thermothielavioides terrestris NRRL 8126]AEO63934.1 hypothetical protein THITE_2109547 [Thermothielavioides terrestris NRRL 8126]
MGADDVARLEVMLPFAALANTVPLLFWFLGFVFSRRELVGALREEVEAALVVGRTEDAEAGGGGGGASVTLRTGPAVEERCPRLMSCYRETLRYTVHQVITRTAMQDTVLVGRDGREYLLKEGSVVQMSIGASHTQAEFWGEDVDEFKPGRFLSQSQGGHKGGSDGGDGPGSVKAMRAALQPFGGGTHLCPGRHFAFAEIMAVMSTLLLGFEIEPLGGDWTLPPFATRSLIDAVTKPAKHGEGFGIKIKRRPGWEDVRWNFEL